MQVFELHAQHTTNICSQRHIFNDVDIQHLNPFANMMLIYIVPTFKATYNSLRVSPNVTTMCASRVLQ